MQQHFVGSADGGTHSSVGQPKAGFGNLLHPFLQTTHRFAIRVSISHLLALVHVRNSTKKLPQWLFIRTNKMF